MIKASISLERQVGEGARFGVRVIDNAGHAHLLLPLILHIPLAAWEPGSRMWLRAAINHMHSIVGIVRFWPARSRQDCTTAK